MNDQARSRRELANRECADAEAMGTAFEMGLWTDGFSAARAKGREWM